MKLLGTLISNVLMDGDGKPFTRHVVIDPKALGLSETQAKAQLRAQARHSALALGLGKEGRDWDVILAHVFDETKTPTLTPSHISGISSGTKSSSSR